MFFKDKEREIKDFFLFGVNDAIQICDSYTLLEGYVQERHQGVLVHYTYTVNWCFISRQNSHFLKSRSFTSIFCLPNWCSHKERWSKEESVMFMRMKWCLSHQSASILCFPDEIFNKFLYPFLIYARRWRRRDRKNAQNMDKDRWEVQKE